MPATTSVMWFRRDLRLRDLPALSAAAQATNVVPLFVVDPAFDGAGLPRRAYLAAQLRDLNDAMGGALVVRRGAPEQVVPELAAEVGAGEVHVTRDFGPYGRRRDAEVATRLADNGRRLVGTGTNYAVAPGAVTKADGTPYAVFTPFARAWRAAGWVPPGSAVDTAWRTAAGIAIPAVESGLDVAAGEASAVRRWERFLHNAVDGYAQVRNLPGIDGTSRLSAALRWGVMHPRQLLAEIDPLGAHRVFADELAWRDFYADVLFRRPETAWSNVNARMDPLVVDTDERAARRFETWCQGATGFPIVDAGMRELAATGFMHNRVRMIVASFLTKDLHIPWQWGARHFMAHLVDGDLASNAHGWQWTAGTGTDAAPYFRVFNPTTQGRTYDPDGVYVRQWVPELRDVPGDVHDLGRRRPQVYPSPMVDHAVERVESLARYQRAMGR